MSHHGILIHVIFSTRFRSRTLARGWREDLFAVMGSQVASHDGALLAAGGIEDHVHLLIKIHPSFAIADTIRNVKAHSSQWINASGRLRGKFHWQRGYAAFSVSQSNLEAVRQYISNQAAHHRRRTFKEEYLEFLRRHKITFDMDRVFEDELLG